MKRVPLAAVLSLSLVAMAGATAERTVCSLDEGLQGRESWAGIKAHPAVVNPVGRDPEDPNTLSLKGTWDFRATLMRTQRGSPGFTASAGTGTLWNPKAKGTRDREFRQIEVPGCWEMQGVGEAQTSMPCFVRWDVGPKPMKHCFWGDGWYRKSVTIPAAWAGKRIWLKTGWANSYGLFWVNGHPVAYDFSYCGTYKYEVTDFVTPGSNAVVVVEVTNDQPSRRGSFNSVNHWGGLIRAPEFEATPQVYIDDAWVRGDFDKQEAEVHVEVVGGRGGRGGKVRVTVEGEVVEQSIDQTSTFACGTGVSPVQLESKCSPTERARCPFHAGSGPIEQSDIRTIKVPLGNFRPWSPEHPNLYWAKIELVDADGTVLQTRKERFGVRKLEVRGTDFYLNGKPFYMRGAGWHFFHPLEGAPLADRETWLGKAKKVRAAGFNIVRNHTYCNMPEFYEACDEVGLMVQPELPYYTDVPRDGQPFDPLGDARELYEHMRRHPSFAVYSGGNEGWFGPKLTRRLYREVKARDPDRLMVGQDTWRNKTNNQPGMSDFSGGPMSVWPRGSVAPTDLPFVCHEYLNLCVKLDSRLESKYTGVYRAPVTRTERTAWLRTFGLDLAWGDRLQDAQHVMQSVWRKYGFEAARTDPHCDGYSYWSLQDAASPQKGTYSGQALFDPFWDTKPHGDTAEDVAVYNSPSCVLLTDGNDPELWKEDLRKNAGFKMFADNVATNRVRTAGETIRARFHLAHYGDAPLKDASLAWKLVAEGRTLTSGSLALGDQALGAARVVGSVDIVVPAVVAACRAELVAIVRAEGAADIANSWSYWLFPRRTRPSLPRVACADAYAARLASRYDGLLSAADWEKADVVIAPFGSDLERRALAAGKSVVALANQDGPADIFLGWWWMGDQMGAALSESPLLRFLPKERFFNPLFFRIGKTGLRLPVEGVTAKDFVMVGEGAEACFLYLADVPQPNGAHRTVVAGLDVLSDTSEGTALLDGILRRE